MTIVPGLARSRSFPGILGARLDLRELVASHLEHFRLRLGRPARRVGDAALELLERYAWPGNVRELINVLERAVLLAEGEEIGPSDLPDDIRLGRAAPAERAGITPRALYDPMKRLGLRREAFREVPAGEAVRARGPLA